MAILSGVYEKRNRNNSRDGAEQSRTVSLGQRGIEAYKLNK